VPEIFAHRYMPSGTLMLVTATSEFLKNSEAFFLEFMDNDFISSTTP